MEIVTERELYSLEKRCKDQITELKESVEKYRLFADMMDSIIYILKEHYKTEGGISKTNRIAQIDFSQDSFSDILTSVDSFNCSYDTYVKEIR